ncbi:ABC transporter substrate-binding protein [Nonomuraea purpurea]|uniref:ABC transporter substrate-binding protein n=1 Tax=Nonomuraea purpurea TaxID=1849276 RepID=A0ABV8GEI0_9ACTN
MRLRSPIGGLLAVLALTGLTACSSDDTSSGGRSEVRLAFEGLPESWAPHSGSVEAWMRAPYEALLRLPTDPASTDFQPELATKWTVEDKSITLTLREGVKFHDGSAFDAEAVKLNLQDTIENGGPLSGNLASVKDIEVVNDHTAKINLKNSDPGLLRVLGTSAAYMGSPTAMKGGSINKAPVGTGPWAYDADNSVEGGEQVFAAFSGYWGGKADGRPESLRIQGIDDPQARTNALLAGEVDAADIDPGLVQQAKNAGLASARLCRRRSAVNDRITDSARATDWTKCGPYSPRPFATGSANTRRLPLPPLCV